MKRRITAAAAIICLMSATALKAQQPGVLSLDECKTMALEGGVEVRNSHLDLLSAGMRRQEAMYSYFPTIEARAMGFKALKPLVQIGLTDILGTSDNAYNLKYYLETEANMLGVNTNYSTLGNAYGAGLSLTQPIYAGGRIVNGNRLAKLGVEAASLKEDIARRDMAAKVEEKYWTVVSLSAKKAVLEQALKTAEVLFKDAASAAAAGLVPQSECDKLNIELQKLHSSLTRVKASRILAGMDLCALIGLPVSGARSLDLTDMAVECPEPSLYFKEPAEIVAGMDESRLLELSVEQKKLEKSITTGEALPQVGIGAYYGYGLTIGQPMTNGAVYASITVPLSDWAKTSSRIRSSEYQLEKARNDREHLSRMLELKIQQLWVEVECCWEEIAVKKDNLDWCINSEAKVREDHIAGLATMADLMQKEVGSSKAECELIDAQIAYRNALASYLSTYPSHDK